MIKRLGNIVIMILLLIATGGIPVTRHYCGSAEMSFSVYSTPKACCTGHCNKCHNVFKFSRVNDDFEVCSSITTRSLTDIVTLQTGHFVDLRDNILSSSIPDLFNLRNFLIVRAGHSSASLGNFRCWNLLPGEVPHCGTMAYTLAVNNIVHVGTHGTICRWSLIPLIPKSRICNYLVETNWFFNAAISDWKFFQIKINAPINNLASRFHEGSS